MRNKVLLTMMLLLSAALWGGVAVKDFTIMQRWPWNGLVDIKYSIECEDKNADVTLQFTAHNNDLDTAVEMKTLTGDGATGPLKPGGPYCTVWNAGLDVPDALIKDLTISLTATATSGEAKYKLTCKLTPATAKWTVDGTAYASGETAELPEGTYTVSFSEVPGYVTPATQTVSLTADKALTVDYEPVIHKLTCELTPATAKWTVNGNAYASGETAELPEGTYTVSFSEVPGYVTPAAQTVNLTADQTLAVDYEAAIYKLSFELTPATATWTVNGDTYASGESVELPAGTYTVSFSEVFGYVTPAAQTVSLNADKPLTVVYELITYKLICELTPATATWTVNGTAYASGASVDLPEGTYTISFSAVEGYVTPGTQTISLIDDKILTVDYETIMHKLTCELTPDTATWTVNGTAYASGVSVELLNGTYTVSFSDVEGYETPEPQTVVLNADKDISVTYEKSEDATSLYLVIDLSEGANAASYPVRYSSTAPDLSDDTCRTTELWLRKIPAGTFTMGSPDGELGHWNDEGPQHQVTISKAFYMGVFEVTQRQWELVMGNRPSYFSNDSCYATRPVELISYNDIRGSGDGAGWPANNKVDASSFMGRIRTRTGLTFDLPTEAEWEYACRAGTTTALNSSLNLMDAGTCYYLNDVGRYWNNGGSGYSSTGDTTVGTAKVGSYRPNAWGLYDMHGNVLEWCLDWYGAYSSNAVTDPAGPATGPYRLRRGGSWCREAWFCRSAHRFELDSPTNRYYDGFRVASRP